jgi:hypothetical protein
MKHRLLLFIIFTCSISLPVIAQTPRYARVISANANLRDTPSIASANQQEIAEGTVVKVLDEKLPWYVVRFGNSVGWMHGNTIEFMATQDSGSETSRQQTAEPNYQPPPKVPRRESSPETSPRSTSVDRGYIRGPRGGCYYLSGSGRKVYVDRSLCN